MQVDYFDIENKPEAQKMAMPWPMKFVAFNAVADMVRIYYVVMPGATEQHGTFYCVTSEQVLPETFPAQCVATVYPKPIREGELAGIDYTVEDDAVHLFFEVPVQSAKKPRAVKPSGGQKTKDGESGNGANNNGET